MLTLACAASGTTLGRYVATLVAIITGVGFFAATGFLSDRVITPSRATSTASTPTSTSRSCSTTTARTTSSGNPGKDLRISGSQAVDRSGARTGVEGSAGALTARWRSSAATGKPFAKDGHRPAVDRPTPSSTRSQSTAAQAPTKAGEIAVDRGLAESEGLHVGDGVKLATLAGQYDSTIVGITRFGDTDALDQNGTVSIPAATAFDWLNSGKTEYEAIYLRGSVDQSKLEAEIKPLVPEGYKAETGDQFLADQRESIGAIGRYLKQALQAFALLALLVGGFVIYNTFSVIVAQRLRELAVLAAIGATPKQIKRSLRLEGLLDRADRLGARGGRRASCSTWVLILVLKAVGVELPGQRHQGRARRRWSRASSSAR